MIRESIDMICGCVGDLYKTISHHKREAALASGILFLGGCATTSSYRPPYRYDPSVYTAPPNVPAQTYIYRNPGHDIARDYEMRNRYGPSNSMHVAPWGLPPPPKPHCHPRPYQRPPQRPPQRAPSNGSIDRK